MGVAVLIAKIESTDRGMSISAKLVGAEMSETRSKLQRQFRKGKNRLHICYLEAGICLQAMEDAIHVRKFPWHPAGTFSAGWLTATGRKVVKEGATMLGAPPERTKERKTPGKGQGVPLIDLEGGGAGSTLRGRLAAMRAKAQRRVSFGDGRETPSMVEERRPALLKGGTAAVGRSRHSAAESSLVPVKREAIAVDSDGDQVAQPASKRTKKNALGESLAKAAQKQARKKRSKTTRSRSRSKRARRRRRQRDSRSGSSESSNSKSSSS